MFLLAIISDIHGNYPALKSVIKEINNLGCKNIISLGDVVGYYTLPHKCIDLLIEYNVLNLLGNHDMYLLNDCICPRSNYVSDTLKKHKNLLNKNQIEWLSKSIKDYRINKNYFVHGGPKDTQEQYLYNISKEDFPKDILNMFSGHTHVQSLLNFGKLNYCNPGSVGQPRDGDSRTAFAILEEDNTIKLYRVEYDIDEIVFEMKKEGYPPYTYENLYSGAQIGGRIDTVKKENNND